MKIFCDLQVVLSVQLLLLLLLLLLPPTGFCALRCELDKWSFDNLRCVAIGPSINNIKSSDKIYLEPREVMKREDSIPLQTFQKYDWSVITTFILKNANLKKVHPDLFSKATSLEYLDMSGNTELRIERSFDSLTNLRALSLSESSFSGRSDIDEVLKLQSLQSLNISNMRRSRLTVPHIFLKELKQFRNLRRLDISRNNIEDLSIYEFSGKLKSLDLSHNRLKIGERNFENATNLRYLFLSNSNLSYIPANVFEGTRLTHLDLSFNSISEESLHILIPSMTHINLSHNRLQNHSFDLNILSNSVEVFDISYNKIEKLEQLNENYIKNVRSLNVARNELIHVSGFSGFIELVELDLSYNALKHILQSTFEGTGKLETLNLAGNRLQELPQGVFQTNVALGFLSLRKNSLDRLDLRTFNGLSKLYELDLSANYLENLPYDLISEGSLHVLNLSCNFLSYIPDQFYEEFPADGKLVIYGNPWKCSCLPKILYKFRLDPQYLVDGSHPSCIIEEWMSENFCHNAPLNIEAISNWTKVLKASGLTC